MTANPWRLVATRVLTPGGWSSPGAVLVEDGVVVDVGRPAEIGDGLPTVELDRSTVAPGFVDLQICGLSGIDFSTAAAGDYAAVAPALAATGVTAYCPTFITMPRDRYPALLDAVATAAQANTPGRSRILGAHLEGPALSVHRPGVHDPRWFVPPEVVVALVESSPDAVRLVTLAPELAGSTAAIRALRQSAVQVSLGHSDATYEEALVAVEAGAGLVTHLFNAMRPLHHRAPGLLGAALTHADLHASLIADGHHVDPAVLQLAFAALGDRAVLVTDATAAAGMPPGHYALGTGTISTESTGPPTDDDGALAGSVLTMDAAVRNAVRSGAAIEQALRMASTSPANTLQLRDVGRLEPGAAADLVVLDDELRVQATICRGETAFDSGGLLSAVGDGPPSDRG